MSEINKIGNSEKILPVQEIDESDLDPKREDESKQYENPKSQEMYDEADEVFGNVSEQLKQSSSLEETKIDPALQKELDLARIKARMKHLRG